MHLTAHPEYLINLQNISKSWILHTTSKEDQIQPVSKIHTTAHPMTSCSAQYPITNPWSIFKKSQNPGSITPLHTNPLPLHHQWAPLPLPLDISRFLFLIYVLFKYRRLYLFAKNLTQFYCEVLPESYRAINVENNMLPWYTKTRVLCVFVFTPALPRNNDTSPLIDPRFSLFPIWPAHRTFLPTTLSFSIIFCIFVSLPLLFCHLS